MEFKSINVMAYILYKAKLAKHPVNKTQAQKLLYCCYGIIMAKFNERLTDEHPKAWFFGPVFLRANDDIDKKRLNVGMAKEFQKECPKEWLSRIDKTIVTFLVYTASQLVDWSCVRSSPWKKADALNSLDDREIYKWFQQYLPIVEDR